MSVATTWRSGAAMAAVMRGGVKGLTRAAQALLDEANRTVPLRDGDLQKSGQIDVDDEGGEATVYYDPPRPYAARQHEELDFRHAPGRRAKWLELAATETGAARFSEIAEGLRSELDK